MVLHFWPSAWKFGYKNIQHSKSVGALVEINCEANKKIAKPRFTIWSKLVEPYLVRHKPSIQSIQNSKSVGTFVHINCEASKKIAKPRFTIITSMKVVGIIYQSLPPPYSAIKELCHSQFTAHRFILIITRSIFCKSGKKYTNYGL